MAFELLTETPPLLREGHVISFIGGWPSSKDNKWFTIDRSQQIKYDVARIVAADSSIDLDFRPPSGGGLGDKNLSLIPEKDQTCYELLLGFRGNVLVYPMYANSYFGKLETTNVVPDTTNARLRYLGFYDEDDSPFSAPRLREHVVTDQEPPVLRIYNDHPVDERLVIRVIVNRVMLRQVNTVPEDLRRVARVAKYHQYFTF